MEPSEEEGELRDARAVPDPQEGQGGQDEDGGDADRERGGGGGTIRRGRFGVVPRSGARGVRRSRPTIGAPIGFSQSEPPARAERRAVPAGLCPGYTPGPAALPHRSVATEVERRCHAEPPQDGHASTRDCSRPAFVVVRLGSGPGDAHSSGRTPCAGHLHPQVGPDGPALRRGAVGGARAPARNFPTSCAHCGVTSSAALSGATALRGGASVILPTERRRIGAGASSPWRPARVGRPCTRACGPECARGRSTSS